MYSIFDGDASLTSLEYAGPISMPCGIQECLAEHSSLPYDQPAYLLSWTQQVLTNTLPSFFSIFRVTTTSQRTTVLGLFAELCRHENPIHHCADSVGYDWILRLRYGISFARLFIALIGWLTDAISSALLTTYSGLFKILE